MTDAPQETLVIESHAIESPRDLRCAFQDLDLRVDAVEVRADHWKESFATLAELLIGCQRPVIATVRARAEGGEFAGTEEERKKAIETLSRAARWVDLEHSAAIQPALDARCRRIVSYHDRSGTERDLSGVLEAMHESHPDAFFYKIATTPRSADDLLALLDLRRRRSLRAAFMGMGQRGIVTRALAKKLGSAAVYCRSPSRKPTAPGQISSRDILDQFRLHRQTPATSVYAVVGRPIGHSLSPLLHNAGFARLGLDAVYVPIELDTFDEVMRLADRLEIAGLSVTLPFKEEAALRCLQGSGTLDVHASRTKAVNTLLCQDRRWSGWNTDGIGFLEALRRGAPNLSLRGARALIVGAGGAARAAAFTLTQEGAEVHVKSRTQERAGALAAELKIHACESVATTDACAVPSFDLIVNATPCGMAPDLERSVVPSSSLSPGQFVLDMVYRPRRTRLLREARERGAVAIEGLEMFLEQAMAQFKLFTGMEAPRDEWRRLLESALID